MPLLNRAILYLNNVNFNYLTKQSSGGITILLILVGVLYLLGGDEKNLKSPQIMVVVEIDNTLISSITGTIVNLRLLNQL